MNWHPGNEHYQISECGCYTITKYIAHIEDDEYRVLYGAWRRAKSEKDSPVSLGQRLINAQEARRLCESDCNEMDQQHVKRPAELAG